MRRITTTALATIILAACSDGASEAPPDQAQTTQTPKTTETTGTTGTEKTPIVVAEPLAASDKPKALSQCAACHTFDKGGPTRLGPNLWGIHGREAGSVPGFKYSQAMVESGIVWDNATLDAYLANPRQSVPGGTMSFAGIRDDERRAELIAYLATLKDGAN